MPNNDELLTLREACAYLKCSRGFLARLRKAGLIDSLKLGEKFVRIRRSDLDKFVNLVSGWDRKFGGETDARNRRPRKAKTAAK